MDCASHKRCLAKRRAKYAANGEQSSAVDRLRPRSLIRRGAIALPRMQLLNLSKGAARKLDRGA
jgi:hypothetical protein